MPFAIGLVAGPAGTLWQGAAGEARPGVPAGPDSVLRLFSMTKAVGAVAAAILVERGGDDRLRLGRDHGVIVSIVSHRSVPARLGWFPAQMVAKVAQGIATINRIAETV